MQGAMLNSSILRAAPELEGESVIVSRSLLSPPPASVGERGLSQRRDREEWLLRAVSSHAGIVLPRLYVYQNTTVLWLAGDDSCGLTL